MQTNQDAVGTYRGMGIAMALFDIQEPAVRKALNQAEAIFADLQHGKIERGLFTVDGNSYFGPIGLHDHQTILAPLGKPDSFTVGGVRQRGGMQLRAYTATFGKKILAITTGVLPDGQIEQYIVAQENWRDPSKWTCQRGPSNPDQLTPSPFCAG